MTGSLNWMTRLERWSRQRPLKSVLTLLSVCAISLVGCKSGPQIIPWIGEPDRLVYAERAIDWNDARGFQCLDPSDVRRFYRNCKMGVPLGSLNFCVVGRDGLAVCADGEVRGGSQLTNWTCLDEGDSEEFMIFCKRRIGTQ